jgi:UDP-N-acetylmuramate dehydrogenase
MPVQTETVMRLGEIPGVAVALDVPLAAYTRFGIGGPADLLIDAETEEGFIAAAEQVRELGLPLEIIGGGTNLVVADEGCRGAVLRFTGAGMSAGQGRVRVAAGAVLQDLVDFTIEHGFAGIHTMTGVPGWVGGAIYGNAGAYGNSINSSIDTVRFWDGTRTRTFTGSECEFSYRESIFKRHKQWIIFSADLKFGTGEVAELRARADEILAIRNAKYPPTMKCAGSIFKNCLFAQLPEAVQQQVPDRVVREGKVPSAWFLEQVGAKGIRNGDIHVADYHANLIYNTGNGTARQVREVVTDLKARVRSRFGFEIEEEVQYVGYFQ